MYSASDFNCLRHKDWLGSSRLSTTWAHAIYSKTAYAPFGEAYNTAGTSDQDFTGKTQDSVATLADFPYRKYDSNAGRWTAPDPGAWSVVDPTNPRSLNRYAYVMNMPLASVDPLGLVDPCEGDEGDYEDCTNNENDAANSQTDDDSPNAAPDDPIHQLADKLGSMALAIGYATMQSYSAEFGAYPSLNDAAASFIQIFDLNQANNDYYDPESSGSSQGNQISGCVASILNAANSQFGTSYTSSDLESDGVKPPIFEHSSGAPAGTGTVNVNITASTTGVSVGSYPVNWWTYIIGYGPTLHVVPGPGANGGLDSSESLKFGPDSVTMHIDSGYIYNPIGLFFHGLLNFTSIGGYPGC